MDSFNVEDLMVPLSEYATVSEDATLFEAVMALEKAQEEFDHTRYRHRAVLVLDARQKVVGKLSQLDVLRALEPKYAEMETGGRLSRLGVTPTLIKSMMDQYRLFERPLADICREAGSATVGEIMYTPSEGEYVAADASLATAMHQLVVGHHQSLLATSGGEIVGVLRLTDVFAAVFHTMKEGAV